MPLRDPFNQAATCLYQCSSCVRAADWVSAIDWVHDVDWYEELRLVTTSILLTSIIVLTIMIFTNMYHNFLSWDPPYDRIRLSDQVWLPDWIRLLWSTSGTVELPQTVSCPPNRSHYDSTRRTVISFEHVHIYAWPSKGGVIILDHAERVDLEFLHFNPLEPPPKRLANQIDEDDFCQRLLLLGAKWWDSEARSRFVSQIDIIDNEEAPIPTIRERRWVSVAWPSTGGLWVAEFDTTMYGVIEDDDIAPSITAMLRLAYTMDERSQVLRDHFGARFYEDLEDYEGYAFLNMWDEKEMGEVGPLMPLRPMI